MQVKLQNVRIAFPDLFVARPYKAGDTPKYKATFLIPKGSQTHKDVEKAILALAEAKWPNKGKKIVEDIKNNPNKFCFQDGDKKNYDGYAGHMYITASKKTRPTIKNKDATTLAADDINGEKLALGGCYVNAIISMFTYNNSGNGISASLDGVQFAKDGEPFSGSPAASDDDFEIISDDDDDGAGVV